MQTSTIKIQPASSARPEQMPLAGLAAVRMQPGVTLKFNNESGVILSLAVACDMRDNCQLTFRGEKGWQQQLDAGFASHAQRLRIRVPAGCSLIEVADIEGAGELWIVNEAPLAPEAVAEDPVDLQQRRRRALARLRTNALCQFSWMGGCVLDGLHQLHLRSPEAGWDRALDAWLTHFYRNGELSYQCPRGMEVLNRFTNIESPLPAAVLGRTHPRHPVCDMALRFLENPRDPDAVSVTAEGCYTMAYPLAVLAAGRREPALAKQALGALHLRRDCLFFEGDLYLRYRDGQRSFRNWARGICWYLLGTARCMSVLGTDAFADLTGHFVERAHWIMSRQRPDGLWDNFLDEPGPPPDSSGSSGIAAALMQGLKLGLLGAEAKDSAERCWAGLGNYLENDGWLGSVAPNNKRGENEQHTFRRTIEPFALGLYGQLAAALEEDS